MSTWSRVALVGLLLGVACTGDGTSAPEEALADDAFTLVTDGTLTVCVNVPFEPFSFEDPAAEHGYDGFDIALAAEVAQRLDLDLGVANVAFEEITSGAVLSDGTCDAAVSAITVTDEWDRHLDFSAPYFEVKQSLLVLDGAPLQELDAAAGMRIGVQTGMPAASFAERRAPADAEVVPFDNTSDLLAALDLGDIDAVIQNLRTSTAWVDAGAGVAVVETFTTDQDYAMAVADAREDALLRSIDAQLTTIHDDGTRDRLLDRYFALPFDDDGSADD